VRGSARVDSSTPERIKGGQGDARSEFADPCLTGRAALRNIRQEPTRLLVAARRHGSTPSPSGLLVSIPPGEGMGVATGCGRQTNASAPCSRHRLLWLVLPTSPLVSRAPRRRTRQWPVHCLSPNALIGDIFVGADVRRLWAFSSRPTRACWRGLRRPGHPGEVAGVIIAGELARPPAAPNLRALPGPPSSAMASPLVPEVARPFAQRPER